MSCLAQLGLGCSFLLITAIIIVSSADIAVLGLSPFFFGVYLVMGVMAVYFQQKGAQRMDRGLEVATGTDHGCRHVAAVVVAVLVLLTFLIIGAMATVSGGG